MLKIFDAEYFRDLTHFALDSARKCQQRNLHLTYNDPCQRLFNAIEPGSYIRPHLHSSAFRDELQIALRGKMALVMFDDQGTVSGVLRFGTEKYGMDLAVGAEITTNTWHTVISLEPGCVLLEVKAGPFDPSQSKVIASWAPEAGSIDASV
jgi:cupin fold WbuC family metalloprotein